MDGGFGIEFAAAGFPNVCSLFCIRSPLVTCPSSGKETSKDATCLGLRWMHRFSVLDRSTSADDPVKVIRVPITCVGKKQEIVLDMQPLGPIEGVTSLDFCFFSNTDHLARSLDSMLGSLFYGLVLLTQLIRSMPQNAHVPLAAPPPRPGPRSVQPEARWP